jgi:F-box and leucine-rich repeat protein 2/20
MRGTRVTDDAIEALAMKCPLLEAVNLECCLQLTDAGVMTLGTRATRPGEWNDRTAVGVMTNTHSQSALESSLSSEAFDTPRRSDEVSSELMDDDFDELFAMRLKTLSVSGCVRLTDASIVSVAQSCHHLASVDLSQVYDLTDASVVALASNCGQHLTSLKLSRCGRITDYAIAAVLFITICEDHCVINVLIRVFESTGGRLLPRTSRSFNG